MRHISARQLKEKLITKSEIFLLDVREDFEHEDFDIGGTLIPLDQIMSSASKIPRDKPVVVYCRRGVRSQIAIERLEGKFGFKNLINLDGGLEKWNQ